jgi:BirA family biotin operon repressor/biotin-[acetyl-CoA-carboxylase] ligase
MKFKVFKFKKVKSTNNTAIRVLKNTNIYYGMISSESQNNGRGQYGKKWISFKGNLFVSFFFKLDNLKISFKQLTKLNCLLVRKIL